MNYDQLAKFFEAEPRPLTAVLIILLLCLLDFLILVITSETRFPAIKPRQKGPPNEQT